MNTDQWINLVDRISEAWERFGDAVQQSANKIVKIFERIREDEDKRLRRAFLCHYKKNYYLKKHTPTVRIERKKQKYLPYQRRNY